MEKKETLAANVIPELMKAASRKGEVTSSAIVSIATKLSIPVTAVEQVATFYPSLSIPPAKHQISLCKSLSCHMERSSAIYKAIKKELSINKAGVSPGGKFSITLTSCLGLCGEGPAMMVNDKSFTALRPAKALKILEALK